MRKCILFVCFLCVPIILCAQEKTDWYYVEHLEEILPDATALFRQGDYERAIDLCSLHMGNAEAGDKDENEIKRLHDLIVKCMDLAELIDDCIADGRDLSKVKSVAAELRILNPDDKRLRLFIEPATTEFPQLEHPADYSWPHFMVRLGVSLFGIGQSSLALAPELGVDLYNIGDSRFGVGAKFYFGPSLNQSSSTIFGGDLCAVFRLGKRLYPSAGIGVFSCNGKDGKAVGPTSGLYVPLNLSIIIGKGFVAGVGMSIFPEVKLKTGFTSEKGWYGVPVYKDVVSGIVPSLFIGYAF